MRRPTTIEKVKKKLRKIFQKDCDLKIVVVVVG